MDSSRIRKPAMPSDRSVVELRALSGPRVEAVFHAPGYPPAKLWVELPAGLVAPGGKAVADAFFLAVLPAAMKIGLPLEIRGTPTPSLIAGAGEWQAAMVALFPEKFRVIPVVVSPDSGPAPAKEASAGPPPSAAGILMCFSGGVDSTFTARVFSKPDNPLGLPLAAGLFVHGFDIEKNNHAGFIAAVERVRPILESTGARLWTARTNLRDICHKFGLDWGQEVHGIHLAAVLHLFRGGHAAGLIPSTYPVHDLKARWGSQPALDPCLGLPGFPVVHHGAPWNKLGKVRGIADWDVASRHLRVCWEGPEAASNCGMCFKCIATQLCFLASGQAIPPAFSRPFQPGELRSLRLRDRQNFRVAENILEATAEAGKGTWWWGEFEECVREGRTRLAPETLGPEDRQTLARTWLENFSACVRARDFAAGESMCLPGIHGFGTIAGEAAGREVLRSRQWEFIWPRTREFHFCPESIACLAGADGKSLVLMARWESTGQRSGEAEFHRHGRATVVLTHQPDGRYLAAHTHFSLNPGEGARLTFQ